MVPIGLMDSWIDFQMEENQPSQSLEELEAEYESYKKKVQDELTANIQKSITTLNTLFNEIISIAPDAKPLITSSQIVATEHTSLKKLILSIIDMLKLKINQNNKLITDLNTAAEQILNTPTEYAAFCNQFSKKAVRYIGKPT